MANFCGDIFISGFMYTGDDRSPTALKCIHTAVKGQSCPTYKQDPNIGWHKQMTWHDHAEKICKRA